MGEKVDSSSEVYTKIILPRVSMIRNALDWKNQQRAVEDLTIVLIKSVLDDADSYYTPDADGCYTIDQISDLMLIPRRVLEEVGRLESIPMPVLMFTLQFIVIQLQEKLKVK